MSQTKQRKQSRREELSRLIRNAALKVDPKGRIEVLAAKASVSTATLRNGIKNGGFTRGMSLILEDAIGADVLPKEKLYFKDIA